MRPTHRREVSLPALEGVYDNTSRYSVIALNDVGVNNKVKVRIGLFHELLKELYIPVTEARR